MGVKKLVFGVGINDADYVVDKRVNVSLPGERRSQKVLWACPYYSRWKDVLSRCYAEYHLLKRPNYFDCTVCEEWLLFSNFKKWMEQQDWEGKQLDKDLLVPNNRIYCPENCVFVSNMVNGFINEKRDKRGKNLLGVSYRATLSKPYIAQCRNPFTKKNEYLGYYSCELEAHRAWLKRKLELAEILASEQTDIRVAEALLKKYREYEIEESDNAK